MYNVAAKGAHQILASSGVRQGHIQHHDVNVFSLALRGPITNICKSRRRISLRTEESVKKVRGFCRRHRQPNIPALVRPFDMLKICKNLYLPLKLSRDLVICIHPADNTGQVVHQNMGAA